MTKVPFSRTLLAILALIGCSDLAHAAPPPSSTCGVTGYGAASNAIYYNPFDTNPLTNVSVPLVLTRKSDGAAKTQEVYFIITKPIGSPDYQISARAPGGTSYTNVAYYEDAIPANVPSISNTTPGQIAYIYGGASQPDTVTFDMLITVPALTDLSAGKPISLGIRYVCRGTGGMNSVTTPLDQANAIQIDVHVLSGLQTYYSGSDLAFGEIGLIDTATVLTNQAAYRTSPNNHVAIKSSGAYNVTLSSANGFLLKPPSGTGANNQIEYWLKFLNQELKPTSGAPGSNVVNTDCAAVGTTNFSSLPIQATLREGGAGKNPSGLYHDLLTVTVTPLVASFTGGAPCTSYGVP